MDTTDSVLTVKLNRPLIVQSLMARLFAMNVLQFTVFVLDKVQFKSKQYWLLTGMIINYLALLKALEETSLFSNFSRNITYREKQTFLKDMVLELQNGTKLDTQLTWMEVSTQTLSLSRTLRKLKKKQRLQQKSLDPISIKMLPWLWKRLRKLRQVTKSRDSGVK